MQAASFSHRLFRGSRERSLIGVVKTTSSTGGFIAKRIPHAMHVVKEVILWKKTNLLLYNKVGLAANKSKEGGLSYERHK